MLERGLSDVKSEESGAQLEMDVVTLQRLMGHEDQETIHRYLTQIDDDLRLAYNRYGVVDKMMGGGE